MSKDDIETSKSIKRRTVLTGLATASASGVMGIGAAEPTGAQQFVGATYCPLTDKHQGDATAALNFSDGEVTGRLNAAGFTIPVGKTDPVSGQNAHPEVDTFVFEKTADRFTVEKDDQELSLHGRIDKSGQKLTGTLTRPSPEYGKIAFSFLPANRGFSAQGVANSLYPDGKRHLVADWSAVDIPETGIPKSNSIRNAPPKPEPKADGGDVGFLDTEGDTGSILNSLDSRCDQNSTYMDWDYDFGTSAQVRYDGDGNVYTDYDEIAAGGGYKRYQMESYFTSAPSSLMNTCDQETGFPYQSEVQYEITHAGDTTINDASFDIPKPDDQNDTTTGGDGIVGLSLDIVNAVTGAWGGVATAVLNYALKSDSDSDIIVKDDISGDSQLYEWYLTFDGYNDEGDTPYFVDEPDNAAGASIQVENGSAPGQVHNLKSRSVFEFNHYRYYDGKCPCEIGAKVFTTSQTGVFENALEYNSVDA
jgi:hypothetical protein